VSASHTVVLLKYLSLPELVFSVGSRYNKLRERHLVAISGAEEPVKRTPSRALDRVGTRSR
jgi:hypothetical protein